MGFAGKEDLLACALAAFATATRNVGIFLLVPGLRVAQEREGVPVAGRLPRPCALGSPGVRGVPVVAVRRSFLFYTEQRRWGREATPLDSLLSALSWGGESLRLLFSPRLWADPSLGRVADALEAAGNAYNLVFLGLALALLIAACGCCPDLSAYAFLLILPPTFFEAAQIPLMGLPRYVLVAFLCSSCSACCSKGAGSSASG